MAEKIIGLRVFGDTDGKMNRDLAEVNGGVLVVSQFTLYGDASKGRRPQLYSTPRRRILRSPSMRNSSRC